jgi:hypothetical protein
MEKHDTPRAASTSRSTVDADRHELGEYPTPDDEVEPYERHEN